MLILTRDKYFFNHRLKSSFIDFQVKLNNSKFLSNLDNATITVNFSNYVFSEGIETSSEMIIQNDALAIYNQENSNYEIVFRYGLRNLTLYNTGYEMMDGDYSEVYIDANTSYYYHEYRNVDNEVEKTFYIFKCENKWYIADYNYNANNYFQGSVFETDQIIFGDSPIPPFQFKSSNELRDSKPYIVWNDNNVFPEKVTMTILIDYSENSSSSQTESSIISTDSIEISFINNYLSNDDEENPDYFSKEIRFFEQNLYIPLELQKHIVVSLKKNVDLSSSSSLQEKNSSLLNKKYLSNGVLDQEITKDLILSETQIYNHIYNNYIIEVDRVQNKITYNLFEASEAGRKNLTFGYLNNDNINKGDDDSLGGSTGLSFNHFNDVDYEIKYNKEKMCWQIISLLSGSFLLNTGVTIEESDTTILNDKVADVSLKDREEGVVIDGITEINYADNIETKINDSDIKQGDLWDKSRDVPLQTDEYESSDSSQESDFSSDISNIYSSSLSSDIETWQIPEEFQEKMNVDLTFTALEDSTIELVQVSEQVRDFYIYYAINKVDISDEEKGWIHYIYDEYNKTISLKTGDKIQFKNFNQTHQLSIDENNYFYFKTTGSFSLSGNINSMTGYDVLFNEQNKINNKYCFYRLFYQCNIVDAKEAFICSKYLSSFCCANMFEGCEMLISTPIIYSYALAPYCFKNMFKYCNNLVETFELPIKTLITGCYESMFYGCISLINVPLLPATILAKNCYKNMFAGCSSFTNIKTESDNGELIIKELPATTLDISCYEGMFSSIYDDNGNIIIESGLTKMPELLSTSFIVNKNEQNEYTADFCYAHMFQGCKNLTESAELKVKNQLSVGCYHKMFADSSIVEAPELYSDILPESTNYKEGCYSSMFENCHSLISTPKLNAVNLTPYCYHSMFKNCINLNKINNISAYKLAAYSCSHMFDGCISLTNESQIYDQEKQENIFVSNITEFYFEQVSLSSCSYMFANCTSLIKTLVFYPTTMYTKCYEGLYWGCTNLQEISALPAKEMAYGCYSNMFYGCEKLVKIPSELPSSKLLSSCYESMFENCISLVNAPSLLKIKTISSSCCKKMFKGCTSLQKAPELVAKTLFTSCYEQMFYGCTSLIEMSELPATTLVESCYKKMFMNCINLTTSVPLRATNLVDYCYESMFENCIKLNYIQVDFETWHQNATYNWVRNVALLGAFRYKFDNLSFQVGDSKIPKYWYLLDSLPDSPLRITAHDNVLGVKLVKSDKSTDLMDNIYYIKNNSYVKEYDLNKSEIIILQPQSFVEFWSEDKIFSKNIENYFQFKVEELILHENPLTFTAVENNSKLSFNYNKFYQHDKIGWFYYKLSDYEDWIRYENGEIINLINQGDSVKFLNINPNLKTLSYNQYEFMYFNSIKGKFKISGDINSLVSNDNNVENYGFYKLFYNMSSILDASDLIINAKTVGNNAYEKMFYGCTCLKNIGDIISTSVATHAYYQMFYDCENLNIIGDISSQDAGYRAYEQMFVKNKMTRIGNINTIIAGEQAYYSMFNYSLHEDRLLSIGNITADTIGDYAYKRMFYQYEGLITVGNVETHTSSNYGSYYQMFYGCVNLETVGSLLHCYMDANSFYNMFEQCESLKQIGDIVNYGERVESNTYFNIGFTDSVSLKTVGEIKAYDLSPNCYENMFYGCINLTTVGDIYSSSLADYCYESMFENCSSLKSIDIFNIGELDENIFCCQDMFKNCNSLSKIRVGFVDWYQQFNFTDDWVLGVAESGTFIKPEILPVIQGGSNIPEGWTIENENSDPSDAEN